jgi:hypothetical protein
MIEYPITVTSIKVSDKPLIGKSLMGPEAGSWVKVRVASDTATYLGVFLGDAELPLGHSYNKETGELEYVTLGNPAIWVPDLKRVVFGCESWWGKIKTPEDLRSITNTDIENVWYVRALKDLETKA